MIDTKPRQGARMRPAPNAPLPQFPIYIPSKGRWQSRLTSKALDRMGVPYRLVVEAQEYKSYVSEVGKAKVLVLDREYQEKYDTCDDLGATKSRGPGPARNFIWDHSISEGHAWHWTMDDNIAGFLRTYYNRRVYVADGTIIRCMEDFCLRYTNIAMAGPQYAMFVPSRLKGNPYALNTRVYSCNLIRNDVPFRWRGRYNEDTILSLDMLKTGWCTVEFNAFLQRKVVTQALKGGNTAEFYAHEGTHPKSQMLVDMHPDVAKLVYRYGRVHHVVNYRPFRGNKLSRKPGLEVSEGVNDYGMVMPDEVEAYAAARRRALQRGRGSAT